MAGKPGRSGRPKGSFAPRPTTQRVREILILHSLGFSYAEIGRRLNISRQAVHQSVHRWRARSASAPHKGAPPMTFTPAPLTTVSLPGAGLGLVGPDYNPDTDTLAFTLHSAGWDASVRLYLVGPEEQRRLLELLLPLVAELRRRLGLPSAA